MVSAQANTMAIMCLIRLAEKNYEKYLRNRIIAYTFAIK